MRRSLTVVVVLAIFAELGLTQQVESHVNEVEAELIADALRGEDGFLAVRYHQMLDICVRERPYFEVSVSERFIDTFGLPKASYTLYEYRVTVPNFMAKAVQWWHDDSVEHRLLYESLHFDACRNEKRSFHAALVGAASKYEG